MRWQEIREQENRGPISRHLLNNTGELGHIEDVLSAWVEGETEIAQPYLLGMRAALQRFNRPQATLYRGFVIDYADEMAEVLKNGITIRHQRKALESWSRDPRAVEVFMAGWDRPWVMLTANGDDLDTIVDLVMFDEYANPHTRMHEQSEVIVLAKPEVHYPPEQVSTIYSEEELKDYFGVMTESKARNPYGYWIGPEGDLHSVAWERHAAAIYDLNNSSQGDAIQEGWIRVVTLNERWGVEISRHFTQHGLATLMQLMKDKRGATLDLNVDYPDDDWVYETDNPSQTRAVLKAFGSQTLADHPVLSRFKTN